MRQVFLLVLVLFLISCDNGGDRRGEVRMAPDMASKAVSPEAPPSPQEPEIRQKKIIRNADMAIRVGNLRQSMQEIEKLTKELGGYVSHSSTQDYDEANSGGNMTCQVPAQKL